MRRQGIYFPCLFIRVIINGQVNFFKTLLVIFNVSAKFLHQVYRAYGNRQYLSYNASTMDCDRKGGE